MRSRPGPVRGDRHGGADAARLAADLDDLCARDACGPRRVAPRPWQGGAVDLGRIAGGEDDRVVPTVAQLAQPLDGPAERELGTAEPVDEVAAPDPARLLHRPEERVDRGEAPLGGLGGDRLAFLGGQRFRIVDRGKKLLGEDADVEDGGGGDHRSRPRPATDFVDTGDASVFSGHGNLQREIRHSPASGKQPLIGL